MNHESNPAATPAAPSNPVPTPDASAAPNPPANPTPPAPLAADPAAVPAPPAQAAVEPTPTPAAPTPDVSVDDQVQAELDAALGEGGVDALVEQSLAETDPDPNAEPAAAAKPGQPVAQTIVRGRIASLRGDDVFVDITGGLPLSAGAKLQGIVPGVQFERAPRLGSIMDFVLDKIDEASGLAYLSREGAVSLAAWENIVRGSVVEARVTKTNKGGLELEMPHGVNAFMPASQIDLFHVDDLEQFVGQKLTASVGEVDRRGKKVMLSRRNYLEIERGQKREKVMAELEVGQERDGIVSKVMDFGAFIDLGGIDGLVHVTDLAHGHVNKPSDVVKAGDKVTVKVLKIDEPNEKSRGKHRIALGMKQIQPDPWDQVPGKYTVGEQVTARVTRTANFGAFVEVEAGVEGLMPISEVAWKRIHRVEDVVKQGDVITVQIIRLEPEKNRMTLSLKQAQGDPWATGGQGELAADSMVTGKVTSVTDFGAFVELSTGVEGLCHISELSDRRVEKVADVVNVGDEKEFRVKSYDAENKKISLSLKPAGSGGGGGGRGQGGGNRGGGGGYGREQPVVKGPVRARPPKDSLKSGLGDVGGMGLGGLSLDGLKP